MCYNVVVLVVVIVVKSFVVRHQLLQIQGARISAILSFVDYELCCAPISFDPDDDFI